MYKPWSASLPPETLSKGLSPNSACPSCPGSSLPSSRSFVFSHLAALPQPRWRCPQGLPCLAGGFRSALPAPGSGALRLLLTSIQLRREEERRAARGWIRDSRFGVCSQLPGNSALVLPPLSNYSPAWQGTLGPFLSRRVRPGYLATPGFPSFGVTQHSVAFQLPLATFCPLPLRSL